MTLQQQFDWATLDAWAALHNFHIAYAQLQRILGGQS